MRLWALTVGRLESITSTLLRAAEVLRPEPPITAGPVQTVDAGPVIDKLMAELDRMAHNTAVTDALLAEQDSHSRNGQPLAGG